MIHVEKFGEPKMNHERSTWITTLKSRVDVISVERGNAVAYGVV
jgi:hypothetical protein